MPGSAHLRLLRHWWLALRMKSNGLSMLSRRHSNFSIFFWIYRSSRNPNGTYKGWIMTSDCHKNFWGLDGNKVILIIIVVHFTHVSFLSGHCSRLQYRLCLHGCYCLTSCLPEVRCERVELPLIESMLYKFTCQKSEIVHHYVWITVIYEHKLLIETLSTFGNLAKTSYKSNTLYSVTTCHSWNNNHRAQVVSLNSSTLSVFRTEERS
jgi:hypothetical protein